MPSTKKTLTRIAAGFVGAVMMTAGLVPVAMAQQIEGAENVVARRRAAALAARARRAVPPVSASVRGVNIVGVAWTSDHEPIPNPRLHLRNVLSGRVAAVSDGNEHGEFVFVDIDDGTYVVELVDRGDRVKAVGEVVTVVADETVATFVVLSNTAPVLAALGANLGAAAMSSAANVGLPAIQAGIDISGQQ